MLQLNDIHLKRGTKELFEALNFVLHGGQRVGLVGRNGCGKSTLFALIRQRLLPEVGDVKVPGAWRIAWMAQETEASEVSAMQWALDGDPALMRVQRRIDEAERDGNHEALGHLYAEFENLDGYTAEARAGTILHGLGFDGDDFARPVSAFSGGWRIRLNLARTLMTPAELLLLDEPTNHLDVDATLWLEQWLRRFDGTQLIISHDREFLDGVATHIAHMEQRRVQVYKGNYSSFERQRAENLVRAAAVHDKQQKRAKEIQAFVDRFKAKATKARQAQSRMKALARLTATAPVHAEAPYRFEFNDPERMSNPLFGIVEGRCGYGELTVLDDVELRIYPGSRIGLLGRNGAGKSTLIKSICGEIEMLGGSRLPGDHCPIGYFAQHTVEGLNLGISPLKNLIAIDDSMREQVARNFLGGWGFQGDAATQPAQYLSGGEKARLALALIAWRRPALLLLDEPTNHLDLDMREALVFALQVYEGALMIVSHDRHLLRSCVDEFLLVADGTVAPWHGDLDDYAAWLLRGDPAPAALAASSSTEPSEPAADRRKRRRSEADKRARSAPLRKEISALERRLEKINIQLGSIEVRMAEPDLYNDEAKDELRELSQRNETLQRERAEVEERWLALSESLESEMQ